MYKSFSFTKESLADELLDGERLAYPSNYAHEILYKDDINAIDKPTSMRLLREWRRILCNNGKLKLTKNVLTEQLVSLGLMVGFICEAHREKEFNKFLVFSKRRPIIKKTENPLVSVLIPAFNPRYFFFALDSVLASSYKNIEIIICDDCPTNAIEKVVRDYNMQGKSVVYIRNKTTQGSKKNAIQCFNLAKGKYIKFLFDDDKLHPDCIKYMVSCLNTHPNVTLITSHRQRIDTAGNYLEDTVPTLPPVSNDSIIDGASLASKMLQDSINFIGEPSTVMFRKKDLQDVKPTIFSYLGRESVTNIDVTMWVNLLGRGDAIYLTQTLSYFRQHAQQIQICMPNFAKLAPAAWEQIYRDADQTGLLVHGEKQLLTQPLTKKPWQPNKLGRIKQWLKVSL